MTNERFLTILREILQQLPENAYWNKIYVVNWKTTLTFDEREYFCKRLESITNRPIVYDENNIILHKEK